MGFLFPKPKPTLPPPPVITPVIKPIVGVVCHRIIPADIVELRYMGVKHVRVTLYADNDGEDSINTIVNEKDFAVLVVSKRNGIDRIEDRKRWPTVTWQYGNEPDWEVYQDPNTIMWQYNNTDVSCGLRHGTPVDWMYEFASELIPALAPLATHCYGEPLSAAVLPTIVDGNIARRWRDLWFTEMGVIQDAVELNKALNLLNNTAVKRAYIYALYSPDDGYSLTQAQKDVIKAYIG